MAVINNPVNWKLAGTVGKINRYLIQKDDKSSSGNQAKAKNPAMIKTIEAARVL